MVPQVPKGRTIKGVFKIFQKPHVDDGGGCDCSPHSDVGNDGGVAMEPDAIFLRRRQATTRHHLTLPYISLPLAPGPCP